MKQARDFLSERLLFLSDVKSKANVENRVIYVMLSMFVTEVKRVTWSF